ncbi:hypothetical protein ACLK19_15245 [Escherichia coli]
MDVTAIAWPSTSAPTLPLIDGRLDAVVFTGGIGENAAMVRWNALGKLGVLGFDVDHDAT